MAIAQTQESARSSAPTAPCLGLILWAFVSPVDGRGDHHGFKLPATKPDSCSSLGSEGFYDGHLGCYRRVEGFYSLNWEAAGPPEETLMITLAIIRKVSYSVFTPDKPRLVTQGTLPLAMTARGPCQLELFVAAVLIILSTDVY